jgi:2-phosphosulfolactate phosphatase
MFHDQSRFDVRMEWGERGLEHVAAGCEAVIIVDVISFSTCVDVAVSRGAAVLPYPYRRDAAATAFAQSHSAVLAVPRKERGYSLSPASLTGIPAGTRLVLPSPNGSALTVLARAPLVLAGCLRNAAAVAEFIGGRAPVAVLPCGERWPDGSLRPAVEDLVGAGAIIAHLPGRPSPEARAALAAYRAAEADLAGFLAGCASARELAELGFAGDLPLAAELNVSRAVPLYRAPAYVNAAPY